MVSRIADPVPAIPTEDERAIVGEPVAGLTAGSADTNVCATMQPVRVPGLWISGVLSRA
jgi:hypothetical protein